MEYFPAEATKEILDLTKKVAELEEKLRKVSSGRKTKSADLSDGDEAVELQINFAVSARVKEENWIRNEIVTKSSSSLSPTWNDLFRAIAPRIAPVASSE